MYVGMRACACLMKSCYERRVLENAIVLLIKQTIKVWWGQWFELRDNSNGFLFSDSPTTVNWCTNVAIKNFHCHGISVSQNWFSKDTDNKNNRNSLNWKLNAIERKGKKKWTEKFITTLHHCSHQFTEQNIILTWIVNEQFCVFFVFWTLTAKVNRINQIWLRSQNHVYSAKGF